MLGYNIRISPSIRFYRMDGDASSVLRLLKAFSYSIVHSNFLASLRTLRNGEQHSSSLEMKMYNPTTHSIRHCTFFMLLSGDILSIAFSLLGFILIPLGMIRNLKNLLGPTPKTHFRLVRCILYLFSVEIVSLRSLICWVGNFLLNNRLLM